MSWDMKKHCKLIAKMKRSGLKVADMPDDVAQSFLVLHQQALLSTMEKPMKASDYLFARYDNGIDGTDFCIVSRQYWEEHNVINDIHFQGRINLILPSGFDEISESTFQYYSGTADDGEKALLAAGFEKIPDNKRP